MADPIEDGSHSTILEARGLIHEATRLLLRPTPAAVAQCAALLERVAASLTSLKRRSASMVPSRRLAASLVELQRESRLTARLLASAAAFHDGWARLAASMSGYTRTGQAPEPAVSRRFYAQG